MSPQESLKEEAERLDCTAAEFEHHLALDIHPVVVVHC
jgi:hypothetical protein